MALSLKSRLAATAIAAALTPMAFTLPAFAQADAAYPTQEEFLMTADEALSALTQVHAARLALFENDVSAANTSVQGAIEALSNAEADFDAYLMQDFPSADGAYDYLPFDMSMSLSDTFVATEENALALQQAQGLFESASPDEAVEVLRLADIEVQVSVALMPYDQTRSHLAEAVADIEAGNYFEANLELKAIGDSIVVRTFAIDAIPVQGATQ